MSSLGAEEHFSELKAECSEILGCSFESASKISRDGIVEKTPLNLRTEWPFSFK